jgi:phosphoribosylformylglycinamidine cyclo-ligase
LDLLRARSTFRAGGSSQSRRDRVLPAVEVESPTPARVPIDQPEAFAYHSAVTRTSDEKPNAQSAEAESQGSQNSESPNPEAAAGPSAPAYAAAGVDLDHDEAFIDDVKEIAKGTFRPEVLSSIGGFAGMFKAPERYREPIFVAATDGVGTKLKLAAQIGRYDTIGIDCVAMVVNDLVVQGAEPIIFLDYIAMGELSKEVASDALRGVAEGCRRAGAALIGGETATMPGVYPKGELEIVGFSVGVVERESVIDGSTISEGDILIGMASSGFHSNGYSLVRSVVDAGIKAGELDLFDQPAELRTSLASALIAPTRIYVKPILNLIRDFEVHGLIHVTGGGFDGNIPRILPAGVRVRLDTQSWPRPEVYDWISRAGQISESEMLRVFNCGIGMIAIIPPDLEEEVLHRLQGLGERGYKIGAIERKNEDEAALLVDPGFLAS